ncbi:SWI/SNF complex subunit SMARCC2 [Papilio machaon]|uniref:SWI/SNF complex subunit SMARCC2 n=1 Tax=Papilio machaon TaxID=76193 RepID=A0A194R4F2_PAPMA|nr:SWI/SNF complex subunit SMARCC2 [Papilio machaon]
MASLGPKKDGGPNVEFFQAPESLAQFDQIRVWLQKNCKKHVQTDPPTKEGLAQLVIQLIQYQENKLGKNASDPPFLRLPMKVFMDMKPGGSLCTVLATMFRFKSEQRWRKFDFQVGKNPSRKDLNVQMMMEIESALMSAEVIRSPCVYIRPDVDKATANKVKDIVSNHQGEICEDEEDATHIIYPTVDPLEEEYARPVFRRGNGALVHWYYLPDSHDIWTQTELPVDVPETVSWECTRSEPWRVSASWALDLPQYNEWMNEEDYEVDANGKKKVHKLRLSVDDLIPGAEPSSKGKKSKRKRSPSPPPQKHGKRKRYIEDEEDATHIIYPTVDPLEEEYARPVFRRGNGALVHWYYLPDSHDIWTQTELPVDVPENVSWECTRSEPWRVSASWALDLPQYNEWMNEEDYEVDANGKKKVHKLRLSVDDLIPGAEPSSKGKKSKRKRSPSPPPQKHGKRKSRISKRRDNEGEDEDDTASRDNTDTAPTPEAERSADTPAAPPPEPPAATEAPATPAPAMDVHDDSQGKHSDSNTQEFKERHRTTLLQEVLSGEKKEESSEVKTEPMEVEEGEVKVKEEAADTQPADDTKDTKETASPSPESGGGGTPAAAGQVEAGVAAAAAAALASAAVKAKHLAGVEERKIKSLVALLVETQMKKLEIKLRHFEELEATMEREREGLEYQRQQLIQERQQFHLEQLKAAEFRARHQAHQRYLTPPPHTPSYLYILITLKLEAESRPTAMGPPPTSHFHVLSDTPSGLQPLQARPTQPRPAENAAVPKVEAGLPNGADGGAPAAPAAPAAAAPIKQEPALDLGNVPGLKLEPESGGGGTPAAAGQVEAGVAAAAAAALASAAVKAKHLAGVEERKIKSLVALLVETQMKKLEIKLRHFEDCVHVAESGGGGTPAAAGQVEAGVAAAAAAALASAAVKAKHLAGVEERKIKSLVALLVETQMKKLEIKLRHFEELEATMEREREGLEYQRQQLIQERQQFHLEQLKAAEFRARHQAHQRLQAESGVLGGVVQATPEQPPPADVPAQPLAPPHHA